MFPLLDAPGLCRVCGHDRLRPLHVYGNERRRISQSSNLALMGCETCGVMFSHPLPSQAEIAGYYSESTGYPSKSARWDKDETERRRTEKLARCEAEYRLLSGRLEGSRPGADPRPKVLDFGCGRGEWMDVLAAHGWDTCGLDPGGPLLEDAARRHLTIDELPTTEIFQFVIANRVLEHVGDPLTILTAIAAATVPNGYLYVTVPDFGRLSEHRRLSYVTNDVHINSYTFSGLRSLLSLAGFVVVENFQGAEWDAISTTTRDGLRCLARKTGSTELPGGEPLGEAVSALRAYAETEQEEPHPPSGRPAARNRVRAKARSLVGAALRSRPAARVKRSLARRLPSR